MKQYIKPTVEELKMQDELMFNESIGIVDTDATSSDGEFYDDSRMLEDSF